MIDARTFLKHSESLDRLALRQLSHVRANWELTWDVTLERYVAEDDSFASRVNQVIEQLSTTTPPSKYHDNEDRLAEYVKTKLNWKIQKVGNRWVGENYPFILEQGAFDDIDQEELLQAAAGRIKAAIARGQLRFDQMEWFHRKMLADVIAIILYYRADA
jgi:hypothetical protein